MNTVAPTTLLSQKVSIQTQNVYIVNMVHEMCILLHNYIGYTELGKRYVEESAHVPMHPG